MRLNAWLSEYAASTRRMADNGVCMHASTKSMRTSLKWNENRKSSFRKEGSKSNNSMNGFGAKCPMPEDALCESSDTVKRSAAD